MLCLLQPRSRLQHLSTTQHHIHGNANMTHTLQCCPHICCTDHSVTIGFLHAVNRFPAPLPDSRPSSGYKYVHPTSVASLPPIQHCTRSYGMQLQICCTDHSFTTGFLRAVNRVPAPLPDSPPSSGMHVRPTSVPCPQYSIAPDCTVCSCRDHHCVAQVDPQTRLQNLRFR